MHNYIKYISRNYSIIISRIQDYVGLLTSKPSWAYVPSSVYKDIMERLNVKEIKIHEDHVSLVVFGRVILIGPIKESKFACSNKDLLRTKATFSSIYGYEIDSAVAALVNNIIYRYVTEFSSYPWREFRTINLVSGDTFIDIGAFRGYVTVKASRKVGDSGKVIAVEPMKENVTFIRENIEVNDLSNVVILNGYVAEEVDSKLYASSNQVNGVVKSNLPNSADEILTEKFNISEIISLVPNDSKRLVMSITTNGNERSILENAVKFLDNTSFSYEIHFPYLFNHNIFKEIEYLTAQRGLILVSRYPWVSIYKN